MNGARWGVAIALLYGMGAALGGVACLGGGSTGKAGAGGQCRTGGDCAGGGICVSGVCVAPMLAAEGRACVATRDCDVALYCGAQAVCAKAGVMSNGQPCTTDGQCIAPLRCNLDGFYGRCTTAGAGDVGGACQASADCIAGLWCGADKTCRPLATAFPPFAGIACADDGAFRAYFQVPRPGRPPADFFRLPFPSDVRVSGGRLDLSDFPRPGPGVLGVDLVQLYADAWAAEFDGFSAIGVVTFRFSAAVDFATASPDTVRYVDLTPGATLGQELGRVWSFEPARGKLVCGNRLIVRNTPDFPLLPRHTYAVILTTAIAAPGGTKAAPDADLAAVLAPQRPPAAAADAALGAAWDLHQPLRDWLARQGASAPAPSIGAAALFTVQDTTGHMQRLAASVAAQPAPVLTALTLCDAGVRSPCDDGTADRACPATPNAAFHEIHGRMRMPIYQQGTAPYETPEQGGGIVETAGAPQVARTEDVCFALSIPKSVVPPPASGWPLMVHSHGTGGSMRSFVTTGLAKALASGGVPSAVLGFDAVEHGARRGASSKAPDDLVFNLLNPRAARDNVLQGAADILTALRVAGVAIDAAASPTGAAIKFDPAAVTFFGHSQGSSAGALALAFSDAAPAAVLSGAGSFLTMKMLEAVSPTNIGAGLALAIGEPVDAGHPMLTLLQSYLDRSDPLSYHPLIVARPPVVAGAAALASKHVFMSWGTGDTFTPPSTLEATVRSLQIPPVAPLRQDFGVAAIARPVSFDVTGGDGKPRTAALFQYVPDGYYGYDGHLVALRHSAAIADWSAFLNSYLASRTPAIP
jgi:hypothetical protein